MIPQKHVIMRNDFGESMTRNVSIVKSLALVMVHIKPASEFNIINNAFNRWLSDNNVRLFRQDRLDKKTGYTSLFVFNEDVDKIASWFQERGVETIVDD